MTITCSRSWNHSLLGQNGAKSMTYIPCDDQSLERRCLLARNGGEGIEFHVISGEQKGICCHGHGIWEWRDYCRKPAVLSIMAVKQGDRSTAPELCIITTTTQHHTLKLHGAKFHSHRLGSVHGQYTVFPPPLPFVSGPSIFQGRDRYNVGADREVNSSDADDGMPDPSPCFMVMMDFICKTFPEARGPVS